MNNKPESAQQILARIRKSTPMTDQQRSNIIYLLRLLENKKAK